MERLRVLVSEKLGEVGLERLRRSFDVEVRLGLGTGIVDVIGEYDALIVRSETKVTREVLEAGTRLKVVGRAGVGVDNIDLAAASERGIVVVNAPSGNTIAAAELTMGLLLALSRHIPAGDHSLREGRWERSKFVGSELYGKVLGIIGFGRIGREVAKRARGFDMEILAYDPYLSPGSTGQKDVTLVGLEELITRADIISLHTPKTGIILDREHLLRTKRGVRLVNCARGGLIDEEALLELIDNGHVAGAGLDVFSKEPPTDNPLLSRSQVVATPHLGASTAEAQEQVALAVAEAVETALKGLPPATAVNLPALPAAEFQAEQPRLKLATMLGQVAMQAHPGPIREVRVGIEGDTNAALTTLLVNASLRGLLMGATEDVNLVNAPVLARQRGIRVVEERIHGEGPGGALHLHLVTDGEEGRVGGIVSAQGEARLLELDGYPLNAPFTASMLLAMHHDRPNIIGQVGQILGEHGVNIAGMQVGRHQRGGEAVMLVEVDDAIPGRLLDAISRVEGIHSARSILLQEA